MLHSKYHSDRYLYWVEFYATYSRTRQEIQTMIDAGVMASKV